MKVALLFLHQSLLMAAMALRPAGDSWKRVCITWSTSDTWLGERGVKGWEAVGPHGSQRSSKGSVLAPVAT